ncbi:MAG: tripartite tricarboxylate transporter TctB family protein [Thermodesulfobacteriota bacterium]
MNKNDFYAGLIFVALGVTIILLTIPFPSLGAGHPGPALFPNILAGLFIFFGLLLSIKARQPSAPQLAAEDDKEKKNIGNAFFVLGIIIAFMLLESNLGFILTSSVLLFLLMKKLGTSTIKSIFFSILITFFVYSLFYKILRVPLSPGILGW